MATLRAAIDARGAMEGSKQFHTASEQIKSDASGIDEKVSALQKKIAQQFKFATFDERSIGRIESQFETVGDIQDRLFAATHTNLEVALKGHEDYFSAMRIKWQDNESVLTLISKTETAERKKILKQYASDSGDLIRRNLGAVLRMGAITYLANSIMDTVTSMHKAKREGESMFNAFIAGLPIINRMAESARKMADELSGATGAAETLKNIKAITGSIGDYNNTLNRSIELIKAGNEAERTRLEIQFRYEDRLKEIDNLSEKEIENINKKNEAILKQIESYKMMQSAPVLVGNFPYMFMPPSYEAKIKELEKNIFEVESKKKGKEGSVGGLKGGSMVLRERERDLALEKQATEEIEQEYENRYSFIKEVKDRELKAYDEWERSIVEKTRDAMENIRQQDGMTRMERIESLKMYEMQNAETLAEVAEANKILNDEIRNYERSRVDAMKVYCDELRENAEDSSLYLSERFADTARSIEVSMANAFDIMISEGASFKDAMKGFAQDIGRAFSRMAAQMAAQAIMQGAIGGIGGLLGGGGDGGNLAALSTAKGPTGMGYAQGGVFDRGRVVPMANGAIIDRPTYFPMADGKTGIAGEAGPELGFFPLRRNRGRLGIDASTPNISVSPTPVKVVFVDNMREAQIEAMKSKEGENVIVEKVLRNRNLLV
jgi:hypothetical protein